MEFVLCKKKILNKRKTITTGVRMRVYSADSHSIASNISTCIYIKYFVKQNGNGGVNVASILAELNGVTSRLAQLSRSSFAIRFNLLHP